MKTQISTLCCALAMLLAACASTDVPVAQNPPLHAQQKVQSVDHWDNLADTAAQRVVKTLEDRPDLTAKPLYVQPPSDRPFSIAFYNLLRTRLVTKGMQVSNRLEPDSLIIEYDVQTVRHDNNGTWMPGLDTLAVGLGGLVGAGYGPASDNEIVLNTRMLHGNRYVMHLSQLAYINDDEWAMYISTDSLDPQNASTRKVRITAR